MQEVHLLPQLEGHPHLRDLLLLRVPPHLQACPPQASPLQGMEQGEPRPLHPLSLQHKAPVVGVLGPPAWLQPLLEPNSGKSASKKRPLGAPWPPKLKALEALVGGSWKR